MFSAFKQSTNNWEGNFRDDVGDRGELLVGQVIPAFQCPSDNCPEDQYNLFYTHRNAVSKGIGKHSKSNYVACCGASTLTNCSNQDYSRRTERWGILAKNSQTTFGEIVDGSSNVILLGERASRLERDLGAPNSTQKNYGAIWSGLVGRSSSATAPSTADSRSFLYCIYGRTGTNAASWGVNGTRSSEGVASSYHPGGATVAFADGSTHFLDENLAILTLRHLTAMQDGNIVNGY